MNTFMKKWLPLFAIVALAGCQEAYRPNHTSIGESLQTSMNSPVIPTSVMMPEAPKREPGSLWQPGARQFFRDSRAHRVGDIVTVVVSENAKAEVDANTESNRTVDNSSGITNLLNVEGLLTNRGIAPGTTSLADIDSVRDFTGEATTDREDKLTARIAAVVTQVLPNGYLVIQGEREVIVNYELQKLRIQGIVRPEDVAADNTVPSEKIAEARIAYTGRGVVDESQSAPAGVRFLDKWLPF